MLKFHIITPVYNVAEYLDACIQSVANQTYPHFQLLLVNDGSTDGSGEICDQWAQKDSRIRVLHKPNGGAASARNMAMDEIDADYVLFLDSDDYWMSEDVLCRLADRLQETGADVLIYNSQKDFNGRREAPYFPEELTMPVKLTAGESADFVAEHDLWTACTWNKAVKAALFKGQQLRFRTGNVSEDIDWSMRLGLVAERFDYLGVCAVNYRQRGDSITGNTTLKKICQLLENVCECGRLLEESKDSRRLFPPFVAYQYGTLVYNVATLSYGDRKSLVPRVKAMAYMLAWSDNAKIRLLRRVHKLLGFSMMLTLLRIKGKISDICVKRSE